MHISYTKSFNMPVLIAFATLAHMINVSEIRLNTTNYPIFNMQGFIYYLLTSILKLFWSAGIPTMFRDHSENVIGAGDLVGHTDFTIHRKDCPDFAN